MAFKSKYTTAQMEALFDKVNDIIKDPVNLVVDAELSLTSENPVQNKVITSAYNDVHKVATNATDTAKRASDDVDALKERIEGISVGGFVWQSVE